MSGSLFEYNRKWYIIPNGIKWAERFNQATTFDEYMELANEAKAIQSTTGISASKASRKIEMRLPRLDIMDEFLIILSAFSRFFFHFSESMAKYATVDEDDNLYTFQWQYMEEEEVGELFVRAYKEIRTSPPSNLLSIFEFGNPSTVGAYMGVGLDYLKYRLENPFRHERGTETKEDVAYWVARRLRSGWDHILKIANFKLREGEDPMEKEAFLRFLGWTEGSKRPEKSYYLAYIMKHRYEPTVVPLVMYLAFDRDWVTEEDIKVTEMKLDNAFTWAALGTLPQPGPKSTMQSKIPKELLRRLGEMGGV